MPDEYISREAALADFESCNAENPNWTPQRVKTLLLRQPAADVEPVHRAHWEEADWREYDAQSGETIRFPKAATAYSDCRNAFKEGSLRVQSFCPDCGAMMEDTNE